MADNQSDRRRIPEDDSEAQRPHGIPAPLGNPEVRQRRRERPGAAGDPSV